MSFDNKVNIKAMNTISQLKNNLITRIKKSDDIEFLKALQTIFDSSSQSLFELSSEQKESINKGREEIRNGEYISNNQVISEIEKWLEEK